MKKIYFLSIIALLSVSSVKAQQPDMAKMKPSEMAAQTVLDLSKEMVIDVPIQDSLKVVFENFFTEMKAEHESGERPDMTKMENNRDKKVKALLTKEQYKVYQKYMEERKPQKRGPKGPEGQRPEGNMQPPQRGNF